MSGLRCERGLIHTPHMGPSPSRLYALCDIVECSRCTQDEFDTSNFRIVLPDRNWGEGDVVEGHLTCLTCIGIVREAVGV